MLVVTANKLLHCNAKRVEVAGFLIENTAFIKFRAANQQFSFDKVGQA